MTIYLLTDLSTGKRLAYTSITAFLKHQGNPLFITDRHWSNLCKGGYPVVYQDWEIDQLQALSGSEVRADNLQFI